MSIIKLTNGGMIVSNAVDDKSRNSIDCHSNAEDKVKSTDMFFGICKEGIGQYTGRNRIFIPMKKKDYLRQLSKEMSKYPSDFIQKPYKRYAYITSRVKRREISFMDEYLMVLDADSMEDMKSATNWLKEYSIGHIVVNSTPSKFWIICDKIGTVNELAYEMYGIPGIDFKYIACAHRQDVLLLRGFPRPGFTPKVGDVSSLKGSPQFVRWVKRFKEYWESKELKQIENALFVEGL